ncbi:MAG: hypothetical protein AAGB25_07205 [Pseudomonadota bacterium]
MKSVFTGAFAIVSVFVVSACETTSSRPYKASTENIMAMQQTLGSSGVAVSVGEFSAAEGVDIEPTCRALGALEIAPGKTPVEYIRSAFQDELFAAGVIDSAAPAITGVLEQLEFNSFGTGSWDVTLKLASDAYPEGFSVTNSYEFKTSFSALKACQNVIDAFQPTVSGLIAEAVAHPEFSNLAPTPAGS